MDQFFLGEMEKQVYPRHIACSSNYYPGKPYTHLGVKTISIEGFWLIKCRRVLKKVIFFIFNLNEAKIVSRPKQFQKASNSSFFRHYFAGSISLSRFSHFS